MLTKILMKEGGERFVYALDRGAGGQFKQLANHGFGPPESALPGLSQSSQRVQLFEVGNKK